MANKRPSRGQKATAETAGGYVIPPPPTDSSAGKESTRELLPSPALPRRTIEVNDLIATEEQAADIVEAELVVDVDDVGPSQPLVEVPRSAVVPEEMEPLPPFGGVAQGSLVRGVAAYLGVQALALLSVYSLPVIAPVVLFFLTPFAAAALAARWLRFGALPWLGLMLGGCWGLVQVVLMMRLIGSVAFSGFRLEETGLLISSIAIFGNVLFSILGLRTGAARLELRDSFEASEVSAKSGG